MTGVSNATPSSHISQKSTLDRLSAPKYGMAKKMASRTTASNPKTTTVSIRAAPATTFSQRRSIRNINAKKSLLNDKENQVGKVRAPGAQKDQGTTKAPTSASFRTPEHSNNAGPKSTSKKRVSFTQTTKEGGSSTGIGTAAASTAENVVGCSINSLRRSLRETVTPPSRKSRQAKFSASSSSQSRSNYTTLTHEKVALPTIENRVEKELPTASMAPLTPIAPTLLPELPKTPTSILKHQLDDTLDESLLVSPSGPNSFHNAYSYVSPTSSEESTVQAKTELITDPTSANESSFALQDNTPIARNTKGAFNPVVEEKRESNKATWILLPPHQATKASTKSTTKKVFPTMKGSVFSAKKDARSIVKDYSQTPANPIRSLATRKEAIDYETPCIVKNASQVMSVGLAAGDTPKSKRVNEVCLDLTALFYTEQKTARKANRRQFEFTPQSGPKEGFAGVHLPSFENSVAGLPSDERWAEMQCVAFAKWLNFTLDPTEESNIVQADQGEESTVKPALRTLILHQQIAKTRSASSSLFQSHEFKRIRTAIDVELDKGKLKIRGDRDLYSDLGHRKKITSLLLSYSTPWLRLGLETMFGETILPEVPSQYSPSKSREGSSQVPANLLRVALRNFIVNRVLFDEAVLTKYTKGRCKVPSGNFETKYRAEMRSLVLRRILVLVFFLDRGRHHNLLNKASRLFTKSASVKSSREVLISFCRDFLASEGDITKHLGRVGLKVSYKQEPVDEIEWKITNFAIDLRDGVRLTKVVEVLTKAGASTLLKSLRIPAVSRLQKLHNVGVSLAVLRNAGVGVTGDVSPHHMVDGHRSMVLKLMWAIISHYCFPALLDFEKVEEEIQNLHEELQRRNKSDTASLPLVVDATDDILAPTCESIEDKGKAILLRWCQAVCSLFGLEINDFSHSFSDGKALCCLVHYYHPRMLPLKEIRPTSRDLPRTKNLSLDRARYNEKLNSALAHARMSGLGGIPSMMPATDTTIVPDEKSLIVYLCYACARLIESRQEVQAIEKIQHQYRLFWTRRQRVRKFKAAAIIAKVWGEHKEQYYHNQRTRYAGPVLVIERFVRANQHSLQRLKILRLQKEQSEYAVLTVQRTVRFFLARKRVKLLHNQNKVAINVQQLFRRRQAHKIVDTLRFVTACAIHCQRLWRGHASRQQTLIALSSIILFQALARGKRRRMQFLASKRAAVCVQRIWRGFSAQLQLQLDILDIEAVQSAVRRKLAINRVKRSVQAILVLQLAIRGYLARCILKRKRNAAQALLQGNDSATVCQCIVRGFLAKKCTAILRLRFLAATIIQREWRAFKVRSLQRQRYLAALQIQSCVRALRASNDFNTQKICACIIQVAWREHCKGRQIQNAVHIQKQARSWMARRELETRRASVFLIQRNARCWLATQRTLRHLKFINSVILCQSIGRCYLTKKRLEDLNKAATLLQSIWRRSQQQLAFQTMQQLILFCQALWRGKQTRQEIRERHVAAINIQRVYRCHSVIGQLEVLLSSVVKLQAWWRSVHCVKIHRSVMASIIKAEGLVRGHLTRNNLQGQGKVEAALLVSMVIGHRVSQAALTLQSWWRATYHSTRFKKKKVVALNLTALVRGKLLRLKYASLHCNAVMIQSVYRCHVATTSRSLAIFAVIKIQSAWRAFQQVTCYLDTKESTKQIQSLVRAWIFRRKASQKLYLEGAKISLLKRGAEMSKTTQIASSLIQKFWRTHIARVHYSEIRARILCLQAASRGFLACKQYQRLKHGIKLFQRHVLALSSKREFATLRKQIVLIQALCRGGITRSHHCECLRSSVIIQSFWRHLHAFQSYQRMRARVVVLQSFARQKMVQENFLLQKKATVQVQLLTRSWLANRRTRELKRQNALTQEAAALALQRCFRGYCTRLSIGNFHSSAVTIQRLWRGFSCLIGFHMEVSDILVVQCHARALLARRQKKRQLAAVVCLQSIVRMRLATRQALEKRKRQQATCRIQNSALIIQRIFRGSLARKKARKHRAALFIQKLWRAYTVHVDFLIALLGAITIQAQVRMVLARKHFYCQKMAATKIQSIFRGYMECFHFEMKVFSALCLQQAIRRFLARNVLRGRRHELAEKRRQSLMPFAAMKIQISVRNFLAQRAFSRLIRRVSLFQGLVRGHRVRRRRKKRVQITAARLKEASLRATMTPDMRLGARTLIGLHVLQTSRSLSEIMAALQTLEFSTRFSKVCCEAFAHAKATDILLSTIRQCNRSRPHIQLLVCIVRTLRNVAQHDSLLTYVTTVPACEVILDLLQSFRDKPEIFSTAACLVERCVAFDEEVQALCKTNENRKRLKGIYNLCKRKASASISRTASAKSSTSWHCGNPDMSDGIAALGRILTLIQNH